MIDISHPKKNRFIYGILIAFAVLIIMNALAVHYVGSVLISFFKALLLGLICFIYGLLIQVTFKHKRISLEVSFAIGLMATTFYFFILGLLHQLTAVGFYVYILLTVPAGIFLFLNSPTEIKTLSEKIKSKSSMWYLLFLFPLFYAALPSSFFDTLVYHLGIPNLYIQNGGFCATPQFLYANTAIYYEVSLIPAVFAGAFVPRVFHLIVGAFLVSAVIDFAEDYMNIRKRWLPAFLIITMPLSGFLLTTIKNDLINALFILLGIRFLFEKRFPGAGIFWGFAVGIKYFNALPMLIFLLLFLIYQKKFPVKQYFLFSLTFLTALIPLFGKNILYTGNPVFPFLYSLFPFEFWDESRSRMMIRDVGRICRSWKDFLYLPYDLSFKEFGSGGRIGVQFLAFLPLLILTKNKKTGIEDADGNKGRVSLLLVFSFITIFAGCAFTGSIRFFYLPFLILCLFVARVVEQKPGVVLKVLLTIVLLLNMATSVALLNYLYHPYLLYTQNMTRDEYIARTVHAYPAFQFLNRHSPRNSKILLVGETRNYYLKRPYSLASAIDYSILKPYAEKANNFTDWLIRLRADGFDYILVNFPEFYRLTGNYKRLPDSSREKAIAFFNRLEPIFRENDVHIYPVK
ncbi:hypothetical protein ACFLRB_02995 [Acidobacteriota bacterium]